MDNAFGARHELSSVTPRGCLANGLNWMPWCLPLDLCDELLCGTPGTSKAMRSHVGVLWRSQHAVVSDSGLSLGYGLSHLT